MNRSLATGFGGGTGRSTSRWKCSVLLLDSFAVRLVDSFGGRHQPVLGGLRVVIRRKSKCDGVPDIIGTRHLAENSAGLEENRIRESDDATGGLKAGVAARHFHEIQAQ